MITHVSSQLFDNRLHWMGCSSVMCIWRLDLIISENSFSLLNSGLFNYSFFSEVNHLRWDTSITSTSSQRSRLCFFLCAEFADCVNLTAFKMTDRPSPPIDCSILICFYASYSIRTLRAQNVKSKCSVDFTEGGIFSQPINILCYG